MVKAVRLASTATPFSRIACAKATSETGTSPFCQAKPSIITLAKTLSPSSFSAAALASIAVRFSAPIAREMASSRASTLRLASRLSTRSPVGISARFSTNVVPAR